MPWQPRDLMDIKREFVALALQEGANRRELCWRFLALARKPHMRCSAQPGRVGSGYQYRIQGAESKPGEGATLRFTLP